MDDKPCEPNRDGSGGAVKSWFKYCFPGFSGVVEKTVSFNKGRGDSEFKLQTITHDIANNKAEIERMKADWGRYDKVVQRDKEGNPVNNLMQSLQ